MHRGKAAQRGRAGSGKAAARKQHLRRGLDGDEDWPRPSEGGGRARTGDGRSGLCKGLQIRKQCVLPGLRVWESSRHELFILNMTPLIEDNFDPMRSLHTRQLLCLGLNCRYNQSPVSTLEGNRVGLTEAPWVWILHLWAHFSPSL